MGFHFDRELPLNFEIREAEAGGLPSSGPVWSTE